VVIGSRADVDACPGALRPHLAADGALVRLRLPGGLLPARALEALAGVTERHGDGALHLTSRGNLQVRGQRVYPSPDAAAGAAGPMAGPGDLFLHPDALRAIAGAGLLPSYGHERARNVLASPWNGRLGGLVGVADLVTRLDEQLCADDALADLPGRFLLALDDGTGDVAGLGADATWWARSPTSGALLVAGRDTGLRVSYESAPRALLAVARAFLRLRERCGSTAWRVGDLPGGASRLVADLTTDLTTEPATDGAAEPMTDVARPVSVPAPTSGLKSLGVVRQDDGRWAVAGLVPLGRLTAPGARSLAEAARAGNGRVVLTPWREAVVQDLPEAAVQDVVALLGAAGLDLSPGSPWRGLSACAGRPGCAKALVDVRALAAGIAASGPRAGAVLHLSGCERRCGAPRAAHRELVATPTGMWDAAAPGRSAEAGSARR
jgi:precorrin-3B synthase